MAGFSLRRCKILNVLPSENYILVFNHWKRTCRDCAVWFVVAMCTFVSMHAQNDMKRKNSKMLRLNLVIPVSVANYLPIT